MRRTTLLVSLITALLLALLAAVSPTSSAQEGKGEVAFLNITKVVEGDGPTGGFVIEYFCTEEFDSPEGGGGGSGGALTFDEAGPGSPETQQIVLTGPGVCTVEETESNGAETVAYACEFTSGAVGAPSADGNFSAEGRVGGCLDDQSGTIAFPNDELSITVTNTFGTEVIPDDEEPPPAVEPEVVAATPSFTG